MTAETINYFACGTPTTMAPHVWRYLGKGLGYHCPRCDLRVTKAELKANTDA